MSKKANSKKADNREEVSRELKESLIRFRRTVYEYDPIVIQYIKTKNPSKLNDFKIKINDYKYKSCFTTDLNVLEEMSKCLDGAGFPFDAIDDNLLRDNIIKIVNTDSTISKIFNTNDLNENDLKNEVISFFGTYSSYPYDLSKLEEKISRLVDDFLESLSTIKDDLVLAFINNIEIPIGREIGQLEIVNPDFDGMYLSNFFENERSKNHAKKEVEQYFSKYSCGVLWIKTYKNDYLYEPVLEQLELTLALLSLIVNSNIERSDLLIMLKTPKGTHRYYPIQTFFNHPYFDQSKYIQSLLAIASKNDRTFLEDKILQAIKIFRISRSSQLIEIRFLMIVSAIESLLIDKGCISLNIADRTACLLCNDGEERYTLSQDMKSIYSKRSKIVHEGKKIIDNNDLRFIESVFYRLIEKLLDDLPIYKKIEDNWVANKDKKQDAYKYYFDGYKFNIIK